jgi:hypothetical protein
LAIVIATSTICRLLGDASEGMGGDVRPR